MPGSAGASRSHARSWLAPNMFSSRNPCAPKQINCDHFPLKCARHFFPLRFSPSSLPSASPSGGVQASCDRDRLRQGKAVRFRRGRAAVMDVMHARGTPSSATTAGPKAGGKGACGSVGGVQSAVGGGQENALADRTLARGG